MKSIIHLFTLYMLILTLLPCADGGGGIVEIANHLFNIEHQEHTDHEQHSNSCGDDHCSPFCICSCCSSALDYPVKALSFTATPKPNINTKPSFVLHLATASFTTSVWQPPKLS